MSRSYNVIDADGHILEPFTLWNDYLDPALSTIVRLRLVRDNHGKQRLLLEEGSCSAAVPGFGGMAGVGARQGVVAAESNGLRGRPQGRVRSACPYP